MDDGAWREEIIAEADDIAEVVVPAVSDAILLHLACHELDVLLDECIDIRVLQEGLGCMLDQCPASVIALDGAQQLQAVEHRVDVVRIDFEPNPDP